MSRSSAGPIDSVASRSGAPHRTGTRRTSRGAWVRYGGDPVTPAEIEFAVAHYQVAILQPWEREACAALKRARPDMVVLAYKCLSSTRSYEPGPYYTSGLSHDEAVGLGEHLFAHRRDGTRIEWRGYPQHWQMAVWSAEYRTRWVQNVTRELERSPWDGVMADNDVFDDYYGLEPPLEGGHDLASVRAALDQLVASAGAALRSMDKILVPNIAESRREPGRWDRHAAYGGGFEEVWLGYRADRYFDLETTLAQMACLRGPGLTILRTASDSTNGGHRSFRYGLAALWVFGGGADGVTFTATPADQYSGTPHVPELAWDLGLAVGDVEARDGGRSRALTDGWAAVNLDDAAEVTFAVPPGLRGPADRPAPAAVTLGPHEGVLYRRA